MVLLLTDVFLLLTQVLLWIVVGLVGWYVILKGLPRPFLSLLVLLLILAILALAFVQGPPSEGGVLEALWRVISFPLTPFGLGLILLLMLLSPRVKLGKWASRWVSLALILLALSSVPIVANYLAQELEYEAIEQVQATQPLPAGARRVIVLLGNGTTRLFVRPRQGTPPTAPPGQTDRPIAPASYDIISQQPVQVTEKADLLMYTAQLYQQEAAAGTNPLIVVSAGPRYERIRQTGEQDNDASEARDIQTFFSRTLNIPETSILLDSNGTNAHRSAENVRRLLTDQQINFGNQLLLVDSAISMNRSVLTFRQVFSDSTVYARPSDFYALPPQQSLARIVQGRDLIQRNVLVTDFIPTVDSFGISSRAIEEYLTSLYYFLRGWIRPFQPAR